MADDHGSLLALYLVVVEQRQVADRAQDRDLFLSTDFVQGVETAPRNEATINAPSHIPESYLDTSQPTVSWQNPGIAGSVCTNLNPARTVPG